MLLSTHKLIANTVYDKIEDNFSISLHKFGLQYGSIIPDLSPPLKKFPHTKDKSNKLVNIMINNIQKTQLPAANKDLKEFSIKLGIILHFTADYFCFPHNDPGETNLINHLIYEYKLAKKFENSNLNTICCSIIKEKSYSLKINSLSEYIEKQHTKYLQLCYTESTELSRDIKYCIDTCLNISFYILLNCKRNASYKVA